MNRFILAIVMLLSIIQASDNKNTNNFKCDERKYCSQMTSYPEAKFFTYYCPNTKMDGDKDGIPCESQFREYIKEHV